MTKRNIEIKVRLSRKEAENLNMRVLTLDPYQHGVVINALNNLRNDLIEDKRPTDISIR